MMMTMVVVMAVVDDGSCEYDCDDDDDDGDDDDVKVFERRGGVSETHKTGKGIILRSFRISAGDYTYSGYAVPSSVWTLSTVAMREAVLDFNR